MKSSVLNRAAFAPLRVNFARSAVPLAAVVRGARVAVGAAGTYVGFGAGRFFYRVKLDGAPLSPHEVSPDVVVRDIEQRARRVNLFKVYLWVTGVFLFFVLLGSATAFAIFLVFVVTGGFFVRRWDRERRTARIFYDVDSDEIVGRFALCNVAGEALGRTAMLWHVFSSTSTLARKYHAGAGTLVGRAPTRCALGWLGGIELNIECWSVAIGPQQLLFLPDRLLVRVGTQYASLPYEGLTAVHEMTRFVEEGHVPPDGQIVDSTWRFVNKSGGPDLRFNNNRQLPVLAYGELTVRSAWGHQLVIQASNPLATQHAAAALQELARIASAPAPQPAGPVLPVIPAPRPQPLPLPASAHAPPPSPASNPFLSPQVAGPARSPGSAQPVAMDGLGGPPPLPRPPSKQQVVPTRTPVSPAQTLPVARVVAPPPLPPLRARIRTAIQGPSTGARFLGPSETLNLAGRMIKAPLAYVALNASSDVDASTIVLSLSVGDASRALPLPYWPRYAEADPDQRARYLDWMAAGRTDRSLPVGYAFIFFYGLERRVLIDGADDDAAREEVTRLLAIHGESGSFRRYGADFLAFTQLRRVERFIQMSEQELIERFRPLLTDSTPGIAALTAWYHVHRRPLPAEYATLIAGSMEDAKRGAVVARSSSELFDLFSIRYRESFGEGVVLDAAKRPLVIEYHPASATLLESGRTLSATVPDVLGRSSQFRKLVTLWNACVDDLRKANARKAGAKQLDAAAWAALPTELRAEYDHPDQDRWDTTVAATPVLAGFHLVRAGQLAELTGVANAPKITPAQLKKIAMRAGDVGYAMEPEPRLRSKGLDWEAELLVWRAAASELPDAKVYGTVFAMLSLAMSVAMADGVFTNEEEGVVREFLAELFVLDETMRTRVEAMKQLMQRDPTRLGAVAKTLRETRTAKELAKVASVLVAIAAADGTIAVTEEKALRTLYRSLGLPAGDLAAAIAKTGARLERDGVVEMQRAARGASGVPIPPPPDAAPVLRLNQAAIDAIVADTKDVAAILAEVFDQEVDEPASAPVPSTGDGPVPVVEIPRASEATTRLAAGLDVRYHAVLEELLQRDTWVQGEVRSMAARHRLMPAAIVDTINAWSDDAFGDFLIEDAGDWKVNRGLTRVGA